MGQLSKDAPYPRVTTGAFTLKADSRDLPEHKHPPPGVHQTRPLAWEMESFDFFPSLWSKSLGRSRPIPGSLPEQQRGVRAQLPGQARKTLSSWSPASYSLSLDCPGLDQGLWGAVLSSSLERWVSAYSKELSVTPWTPTLCHPAPLALKARAGLRSCAT